MKIAFIDYWRSLDPHRGGRNWIWEQLSDIAELSPPWAADLLIGSNYGSTWKLYPHTPRIFHTAEPWYKTEADAQRDALHTFGFEPDGERTTRLPNWLFYLQPGRDYTASGNITEEEIARRRPKILAVVTNPYCPERTRFMQSAIQAGLMDSMGAHLPTHPRIADKAAVCTIYRGVLAYENTSIQPWYITEKIIHAINADPYPSTGEPNKRTSIQPDSSTARPSFPDKTRVNTSGSALEPSFAQFHNNGLEFHPIYVIGIGMLKTICLCSIITFPYIATATPFDSAHDGKEDSTYYSTATEQPKNKNKAKTPQYTYRFRAAGKDTSGNTCGRLIITKDDTDTVIGEFDYRSKLGKAACDKIGETFALDLRNRKNGQSTTWTITYRGNDLDIAANNGKFKDTVTRNLSKTHTSTDADIVDIRGTQEGDHAFLPHSPTITVSNETETKHPFNTIGCEWLVSYNDEKNGVKNTIDYSSVGKTKNGNIYGVALLQVSNGKRIIYEDMMEYEVVGKSRSGYVLDFGQDHPVSLKVVDDSTVIMGGGNVAKVVARQFYTQEQIDKLRSLTSFYKLGK